MSRTPVVMISSTARDLPDYRDQVRDACLEAEMQPRMMEHLPASDADAIEASLAMVDQAHVYLGIFAYRYGTVLEGQTRSITHLEYERAVQRGIPRLIFLIDENAKVPLRLEDFDTGEALEKLKAFKERLKQERVVGFFRSPDELQKKVFKSLYSIRDDFREEEETAPSRPDEPEESDEEARLPALPADIDLPVTPFRRLQWFRRADARVFFGRTREIIELYEAVTEPWSAPIVLFCGESGVGKSSLLAAGVRPRLEATHDVRYVRRDRALGLAGTLAGALETEPGRIASAWHALEKRLAKPVVVILDQVEERFTRPMEGDEADEHGAFLRALDSLFSVRATRPAGRLVLAFRKEWFTDVASGLEKAHLPTQKVFLERLSREGIVDVVRGPHSTEPLRRRYGLTVEEGLPEMIASNLLKDLESPVGPTLSILLTEMWERVKNDPAPCFTKTLYREFEAKGFSDYLEEQLGALRTWNPDVVESGLVLDVLHYHTTDLGTAEGRVRTEVLKRYPHREQDVLDLLDKCQDTYLLVAGDYNGASSTRLTHDALAPLVKKWYQDSDAPGQRALRTLEMRSREWKGKEKSYLNKKDLDVIRKGAVGSRAWTSHEQRVIKSSQAHRRRNVLRTLMLVAGGLLIGWFVFNQITNTSYNPFNVDEDFVLVEPGTFIMGSENGDDDELPVHEVQITQRYYLSKTEVTQAQWYAVMGNNPSRFRRLQNPVESVSWEEVQTFLQQLNELEGCDGCYRLPTEAEWEYAARAGSQSAYSFGDNAERLGMYAWYDANSGSKTHPVAQKLPNAWGLYDMHGNVWEWVQDWYGTYPDSMETDPQGPETGSPRVMRGGSWSSTARYVRSANRDDWWPGNRNSRVGFRLVRTYP